MRALARLTSLESEGVSSEGKEAEEAALSPPEREESRDEGAGDLGRFERRLWRDRDEWAADASERGAEGLEMGEWERAPAPSTGEGVGGFDFRCSSFSLWWSPCRERERVL